MFATLMFLFTVSSLTQAKNIANLTCDQEDDYCLLPPYPEHGRYTVSNYPQAKPMERYSSVKLDIHCDTGYLLNNTSNKSILCVNGYWSASMPICVRDLHGFCTLSTDDPSVMYHCLSYPGTLERSWECDSLVPTGTLVIPIRRFPSNFSLEVLRDMQCRNGMWDYNHIFIPACGLTEQHLQLEGTSSNHLQLPWHAAIYDKNTEPYQLICGGSLITATIIISAASCFHTEKDELRPASDYLVAMNKIYVSYNNTHDRNIQYSDITEIKIPSSYRGTTTYYEDNIAVVVVKTPFYFHLSVRPVCLDFDTNLDRTQLIKGNSGKTVCSGYFGDNGQTSVKLYAVDFTYMDLQDCKNIWYTKYSLSKDKFCVRYEKGSSATYVGSGLVFLEPTTQRYFLRGVLSEYFRSGDGFYIDSMTPIMKHEHFIKSLLQLNF